MFGAVGSGLGAEGSGFRALGLGLGVSAVWV